MFKEAETGRAVHETEDEAVPPVPTAVGLVGAPEGGPESPLPLGGDSPFDLAWAVEALVQFTTVPPAPGGPPCGLS